MTTSLALGTGLGFGPCWPGGTSRVEDCRTCGEVKRLNGRDCVPFVDGGDGVGSQMENEPFW